MTRRIGQENELRKGLQIDRILHLLAQNELLTSLQTRTPERRPLERIDEEILREEVGGTISLRRSVGDRSAAKKADSANTKIGV